MMRTIVLTLGLALAVAVGVGGTAAASFGSSLDDAWSKVEQGGQSVARAGDWVVERTTGGAVHIWNRTKGAATRTGGAVSDAWITARVKGELAATKGVHATDVAVDTAKGVVTLSGEVGNRAEASAAAATAMSVQGVQSVESHLTWPPQ